MSMADCEKCREVLCSCGYQYRNWSAEKLREQIEVLRKVLADKEGVANGPRAHIAHRDPLARYGTGHPSEEPCIICGRPTFDIIDRYQTADRRPLCSKACFDRVLAAPVGVYEAESESAQGA